MWTTAAQCNSHDTIDLHHKVHEFQVLFLSNILFFKCCDRVLFSVHRTAPKQTDWRHSPGTEWSHKSEAGLRMITKHCKSCLTNYCTSCKGFPLSLTLFYTNPTTNRRKALWWSRTVYFAIPNCSPTAIEIGAHFGRHRLIDCMADNTHSPTVPHR